MSKRSQTQCTYYTILLIGSWITGWSNERWEKSESRWPIKVWNKCESALGELCSVKEMMGIVFKRVYTFSRTQNIVHFLKQNFLKVKRNKDVKKKKSLSLRSVHVHSKFRNRSQVGEKMLSLRILKGILSNQELKLFWVMRLWLVLSMSFSKTITLKEIMHIGIWKSHYI